MAKNWNRASAIAVHGAILQAQVVRDPLIQAILLSDYAPNGPINKEPYHLYHWFSTRFKPLLPEVVGGPIASFANPSIRRLKAAARYRIALLCRLGVGSPSILTLAFCALNEMLGNHQRLCIGLPAEDKLQRNLSPTYESHILNVQLQSPHLRLKLPSPVHGLIYWCEVYWPFVDAWTAVEFHNLRFNAANDRFHNASGILSEEEFKPKYLQQHSSLLINRVPPDMVETKTKDYSRNEIRAFQDLLLSDEDSSDDATSAEVSTSPIVKRPRVTKAPVLTRAVEPLWQPLYATQRDGAEKMAFLLIESGLGGLINPWARNEKTGKRAFSTHCRGALAISPFGSVFDVSPRYFEASRCSTSLVSYIQTAVISNTDVCVGIGADSLAAQHYYDLDRTRMKDYLRNAEQPPKSIVQFKESQAYVLPSILKPTEMLNPEAQPKGLFKGEPFYSRQDVIKLFGERDLRKMCRVLKANEQPVKDGLYSLSQTEVVNEDAVEQSESHVWVVKNHVSVPAGFVHLKESIFPSVTFTAKQLGLKFFHALTGYKYQNRRLVPVYNGVVVKEGLVDQILARQKRKAANSTTFLLQTFTK